MKILKFGHIFNVCFHKGIQHILLAPTTHYKNTFLSPSTDYIY